MPTVHTVLEKVLQLPTKFFVDIGASNSTPDSQSEVLVANGWSGIMFECNPEKYAPLIQRMRSVPVKVISQMVTPDNVLDLLRTAGAPNNFYLSLDIDGYDFYVLKKILSVYSPQMIISEINEKIPPPIKFTVNYQPGYWWDTSHFFGYSISMLEDIKGYKIDSLDFNNVVMTPGVQEIPIADLYRDGYWNMTPRRPVYNEDFDPIYAMPYATQIAFIKAKFARYRGRYTLEGVADIENTGQIQLGSKFGGWIWKYAADPRFTRFVEIGAWNGRGSTCCFYDGFRTRSDNVTLQSYEIDPARAAESRNVWTFYPRIEIIHGHAMPTAKYPSSNEARSMFPTMINEWYETDMKNILESEYVPMKDPQVILLDGGEYVTYSEFLHMMRSTNATVYMLNNTNSSKCPKVVEWFGANAGWTRIAYSDTEGGGWAIYERVAKNE